MVNKMITLVDRVIIWAIGANGLFTDGVKTDEKTVECLLIWELFCVYCICLTILTMTLSGI